MQTGGAELERHVRNAECGGVEERGEWGVQLLKISMGRVTRDCSAGSEVVKR